MKNLEVRHLEWMADRGSSVILEWGEDDRMWECSWISSGERYMGRGNDPTTAIIAVIENANVAIGSEGFHR